ncbi:TMV resistance protein N-like [Prunus avium]|uniref:ADP-ribosyl cyclase/cyclic ADP-ribose hydrolase n=4 Tax=Prunus TaxID=3754 RepID=A0A6P5RIC4_PRUAV|nr:TMV resistance protein N-like [Prunus avium]
MALSSQRAFTSATAVCPWKYQVFLSFRGEDTRRGFTDYLYKQLDWRGIRTFRDDPDLERGTDINPELLTAIEQSRFVIIVLSTNYATSSWCLRELAHIVQSMKEKERIFPIFYDVDPSDVRHQRGSFGTALVNHERNCGEDRQVVLEWRNALEKVANLAGWNSKDYRYETEFITKIVDAVWDKVHPTFSLLDSSEILVGLDTKLKEINLHLDTSANDVHFVGIWGMGGMGKTTLARLVCERLSHNFEGSSFLANVREVYATRGLVPLQKQLLSNILREKNIQVYDAYSGLTMIKRCLCNKKVLLILDDVDQSDQLEMLIREKDCFGLGSRIIITTRDERLLVEHGIEKVYKVMPLTKDEALYLFSRKAFRKDDLEEDYLELSKKFIKYAQGLPLALKTLGSFLYKRSREEWKSALDKLKQAPDRKIYQILKISYDGLEEMQKKFFLDVACFHKFCDKEKVIEMLDSCGFVGTRIVIHVLIEKSLLSISNTSLSIHDLIQEMAREIVRQESVDEPGGRSRLYLHSDIVHVLTNNTVRSSIKGIVLCLREFEAAHRNPEAAHWNPEAFTKMCKLKLLKINNLRLSLGPKYLPNSLRFLEWSWYPSKCLPPSFQPGELAELHLQHSKIDHLWNGIKYMVKLKSIDLSYSENLTRTPDFTGTQNLERLVFEGCTNIVKIHPSIASLKRLRVLNFKNCKSIKSLPSEVELESLETFDLSGCSKVKKIPEFVREMKNFAKLSLSFTAVEQMPSSMIPLIPSLKEIDMSGISMRDASSALVPVKNIKLPRSWHSFFTFGLLPRKNPHPVSLVLASLKDLRFLKHLNLRYCNLCEGAIPEDIGLLSSLEELNLDGNHFVSLPASISGLSKLGEFTLNNCKGLQKLPSLPSNGLFCVNTDNCTSLKIFHFDPTQRCGGRNIIIFSFNCFSLVDHQGSSSIIYLMLKKFLQEIPPSLKDFRIVIPGSEIPEWFSNQSVGDSVIETLPSDSNSKWVGFAFCALFVPLEEISATERNTIYFHRLFDLNTPAPLAHVLHVIDVVSDHLWLILLPRESLFEGATGRPGTYWREKCHDRKIRFHFEARTYYIEENRWVKMKTCLKVKNCGVRILYEQDAEELNRTMKQYSNRKNSFYEDVTDCDIDKSDKVQGAITKRTREQYCNEAGPSGIGNLGKESLCKRMKED